MEKLQFITHRNACYDEVTGAQAALEGGCRWIQLRMKDAPAEDIVNAGLRLRKLCDRYSAVLIIDDHVELVGRIGADGVHLGKNDMPVAEARRVLGSCKIIGATANTFDDLAAAVAAGADYAGIGPFRFTTTKVRLSPVLGLEGYKEIMERCRQNGISIPAVAIGGITADDVADVMATGVGGVAVSGAILNAADPVSETNKIITLLS